MKARSFGRFGFTLVELLVVVIIIGILMALITPAVMNAITSVKNSTMNHEELEMQQAFTSFMLAQGTSIYPPCDLRMANASDSNSAVYKYFRRIYPNYNIANLYSDLQNAGVNTSVFDPGQALVFWLVGFNTDPQNPLLNHALRMNGTDTTQRLFPFDSSRLVVDAIYGPHYLYTLNNASTPHLLWDDSNGNSVIDNNEKCRAYLYFDNGTYGTAFAGFSVYKTGTTSSDYYYNRDTCQIICAGKDQYLGVGGAPVVAGAPFAGKDADNIANFGGGSTMRDYIEKKK